MKLFFAVIGCAFIAAATAAAFALPVVSYGEAIPTAPLEGRITNGQQAREGQFPHQVLIFVHGSSGFCGGSLISPNWVLTAAHCMRNIIGKTTIRLGGTRLGQFRVEIDVDASHVRIHENYVQATLSNDIALIEIPTMTTSEYIQPIPLPAISDSYPTFAGDCAIASGWGKTGGALTGDMSVTLNYVRFPVITVAECARVYGSALANVNTICVNTTGGKSTCRIDGGGPLMDESKGVLIGISSFVADAGCELGYPAGFTRVTSYLPWIKNHTGIPL